jgi:hypothetical protein
MTVTSTISGALVTPDSPWLGLRSFTEQTQPYFFGRDEELNDLYERIVDKPLTVLFGQSGLGKSSLLQAALVPRLRSAGFVPVCVRFDHDAAAPSLEFQLLDALRLALEQGGCGMQAAALEKALDDAGPPKDYSALLWLLFHDPACGLIPTRGAMSVEFPRPVFLIDQFEEIFTLGERPARRDAGSEFRESLAALVENRPPNSLRPTLETDDDLAERLDYKARHARFLLSLREDFLHLLERWRRTMPSLMENRLELRMLSGPQAFLAVVRPGQLREGLPAIIPDQVGEAIVRFVAGADAGVPLDEIDAVPPLLSLVCAELNAQRLDAGARQITQAQFEGHSGDILASFYLRSFDQPTYGSALCGLPNANLALQSVRSLIEDRLLSADGFRESIAFDTITRDLSHAADPGAAQAVLEMLVERRLLTVEERGGVRRIELAHDVLTRIVKTSRDERHEVEAVARAQSEQQRAEAETARLLKERNRLQRQAILATSLAIVAIAGALVGWIGFKRSVEAKDDAVVAKNQAVEAGTQAEAAKVEADLARQKAQASEKQAIEARNQAQAGFEAAFQGLSKLYGDYASRTLENTPGISLKQADTLKSELRSYLLEQLRELNEEQPHHRGTVNLIARLLFDEGADAFIDKDYTRAHDRLAEAFQWSTKDAPGSASEAETYADILLEQAYVSYYRSGPQSGIEFAKSSLSKVRELTGTWPASWRLEFVRILFEYYIIFDDARNREPISQLADRLIPVIEKSGRHFDPVMSYVKLRQDALWGDGNFDRSLADYALERDLIVWFREQVVQNQSFTLIQLEMAAKRRLENILSFVQTQFSRANDQASRDERRAILGELEITMKALESRLPKSTIVYGARGTLLRLQESSIRENINTRSPGELRTAAERHRMVAAALGVGASVADLIVPAFTSYSAKGATEQNKSLALTEAQGAMRDFMSLDLIGVDTVLQNNDLAMAIVALRDTKPDDPMRLLHGQLIEQFTALYQKASRDARSACSETFSKATAPVVEDWFRSGDYEKVAAFSRGCYAGLPIETYTSGDRETFVTQLNLGIRSLLKTGQREEAMQLLTQTLALCDAIFAERPWDWWVKEPYRRLCFDVAGELTATGATASAQPLLRRGWTRLLQLHGKDIDLDHYPELPLLGDVPPMAAPDDAEFFSSFAKGHIDTRLIRFTVACDFNGIKYPFHVYVPSGRNGYAELQDQFHWLNGIRGGVVVQEVRDLFEKLHAQADRDKIDFSEYCKKEYPRATVEEADRKLQAARASVDALLAGAPDELSRAKGELAAAYAFACRSALGCSFWERLGEYANGWLMQEASNPAAKSSLAIALFCQDQVAQAHSIFKVSWDDPDSSREFKEAAAADFAALVPSDSDERAKTLKRLYLIAVENDVSFPDLMEYALSDVLEQQRRIELAEKHAQECEDAYRNDSHDANREKLLSAYDSASHLALHAKRWAAAESWARKSLALAQTNPVAYGTLATALLFQGNYKQAQEIYKSHWQDPLDGKTLGEAVLADLETLEKAGITHPDSVRIRAEFGAK